jgi:ethanolamine utilization protein EutP
MRRIMLIGRSGCGKSTLVQAVNKLDKVYKKTQALEFHPNMIDTPGEYIESRLFYKALLVTSADCDIIALVQSCTDDECIFPPDFASAFTKPVIGIITKADSKSEKNLSAIKCLVMSGVQNIYNTSSFTGEGIEVLRKLLE